MRYLAGALAALFLLLLASPIAPPSVSSQLLSLKQLEPFESANPDSFDARSGSVAPSAEAQAIAAGLGDRVTWNSFGTPQSLINYGGYLATGLGDDPVAAARQFVSSNRALFRLTDAGLANLETLHDAALTGSDAHVVTFRQTFGGLAPTNDGLITVGVSDGNVAYVSSSSAGDGNDPGQAVLSPVEAWLSAAANIGRATLPANVLKVTQPEVPDGWTLLSVADFEQPQYVRLVALPTPQDGVIPAFETIYLRSQGGEATAYTFFVDARNGEVVMRLNRVDHLQSPASGGTFEGATGGGSACGPLHAFEVPAGTTTLEVGAQALQGNDIVLRIHHPIGTVISATDGPLAQQAEAAVITSPDPGQYAAEVCPFVPEPSFQYAGEYLLSEIDLQQVPYPPQWSVFPANPPLDYSATDTRSTWCWEDTEDAECDPIHDHGNELINPGARMPWDVSPRTNLPTFTTIGNGANDSEAWFSSLTPAEQYHPVSPTRQYNFAWTNQWNEAQCSREVFLTPQRNDIDAATANLFAMHNRMHDFAYALGFTETNFNLQDSNFGNGSPGPYPLGGEADPELGDAQAGAVSNGPPDIDNPVIGLTGRNNANQITLNDGIPGITNMYLWQPVAGLYYPPCVDGDFDMSVIAHEYTHAISNRMVGGPDSGLTSGVNGMARAMGESFSDLVAMEYLNAYGYVPVGSENPYTVGAYVTGNSEIGIRNYAMNSSPLNFSNVQGWDGSGGTGPHDDGEIWSAVNFDIRKALIDKYNAQFPYGNSQLQTDCADGRLPATHCPGNRRWAQIMFDAFLLMPATVDMLGARDAYLAADMMRFGGANQAELWKAFAARGFGQNASSAGTEDAQPVPNFESPLGPNEATVTFKARAMDEGNAPAAVSVYVGRFEANVTPIADTDAATPLGATARFVPGTYEFIAAGPGHGAHRFTLTLAAGQNKNATLSMPTNWASGAKGATISGDGEMLASLIDDTESTNWRALERLPNVAGSQVTVDLGGGARVVDRVKVSALLNAAEGGGGRFTALRQFEIWTCDANNWLTFNCTLPTSFTKIYTSPADAFPGVQPRPTTPDLRIREFDVPNTTATHVRLVVLHNQCTGGPLYQGEQEADPISPSDCPASTADEEVRAAELQVFSRPAKIK